MARILSFALAWACLFLSSLGNAAVVRLAPEASSNLAETYGRLPITFEANRGQVDPLARFVAHGRGYRVFLTDDKAVIALAAGSSQRGTGATRPEANEQVLAMRFLGADKRATFTAERELTSKSNYFIGDEPSAYITEVPHYAAVRRENIYPGIDVVFYGNQSQMEYDLIVAPGANPAAIRLAFEGAGKAVIDKQGNLVLKTSNGDLVLHKPAVYQEAAGKRKTIASSYKILRNGAISFKVAAYDRSKPLVIDPVITYGSHSGGVSQGNAIAVDAAGNAYVAGNVTQSSLTFPTVNAFQSSIGRGNTEAFVQKFNATGTALIYSTYLGGSKSMAKGLGIAIDSSGNAYITGTTTGSDFPTTTAGYQKGVTAGGSFITKLAPAGNALVYSSYLLNANATSIAVDTGGSAYVTGLASSSFATTAGALQTTSATSNSFIIKLNAAGSAPMYSTFLGGTSGADQANAIALDAAGNAYVAGRAVSFNFPTVNAFQSARAGNNNAFVAKLNATGSALVYSTYLGGTQNDYATAIAVDAIGSAYVTGDTTSFDFPVLNGFQLVKGGVNISGTIDNAFVTKFSPDGSSLAYSSFLGGNACIGPGSTSCFVSMPVDIGMSIAVDAQGHAYVGGQTQSITFPRVDSLQPAVTDNGTAAFVVKVSSLGGALLYSTLLGGENGIGNPADFVRGLTVDASGNAYGTGAILGFPTTAGPLQSTGGSVVFKLSGGSATVSLASSLNPATDVQQVTLTANMSGGIAGTLVRFLDGSSFVGSAPLTNGLATLTLSLAAGIHGISAVYRDGSMEVESPVVYQVVNPGAVCN